MLVQNPLTRVGYTLSQQKMNTPMVDTVKEKIWNGRTGGNKSIIKTNTPPPPARKMHKGVEISQKNNNNKPW